MLYHSRVMRIVSAATVLGVLWGVGLLLVASPAAAQGQEGQQGQDERGEQAEQGEDDEARMHFRLGRAYYDSGRFEEAADEFQKAHELSQRPQLLYNVFIARRDAGQLRQAIEALERYLELVPDPEGRESLEARLRSMRRLHQQQQSARAARGRDRPDETPADGSDDGPGGQDVDDDVGDPDDDAPAGDAGEDGGGAVVGADPEGDGPSLVPWVVMGAGAAMVAGAVVTGILALGAESQLEEDCPMGACTTSDWMDTRDHGQAMATLTDVLLITGGLTVAAGAALLFLLDEGSVAERDPSLTAACATDGCAAAVHLPF